MGPGAALPKDAQRLDWVLKPCGTQND